MKSLLRTGLRLVALALSVEVLVPVSAIGFSDSATASGVSQAKAPAASVRAVRITSDKDGPAVEITSSRPLTPAIQKLDGPPRLVIDLPNTSFFLARKRYASHDQQMSAVRVDQYQASPPITRVVVDLLKPIGYSWDINGNRLTVHLHAVTERASATLPPSVPSFTRDAQPSLIPVSAGSLGMLVQAGRRIATGSSVSAGSETALLRLARGGEVKVCPGTTVSVTSSQNGHDLLLGMSTGSLEAHYALDASADSVLTPDFRILLAGPGEFHYAISADSRGNTCVSALPGNTASAIVSELMGEGTYQVQSTEQVVFRSGRLKAVDTAAREDCGCAATAVPVLRASATVGPVVSDENLSAKMRVAQPGDDAKPGSHPASSEELSPSDRTPAELTLAASRPEAPLPASQPNDVHVQVEAPLVFNAATASSQPTLEAQLPPVVSSRLRDPLPATILAPAEAQASRSHHGFFGKIRGFFVSVFR
jgi:hypothetical protein